MSNLYEIIEKLCEAEGITITEMCRRANVPRGNLSDLLNNRQTIEIAGFLIMELVVGIEPTMTVLKT